MHMVKSSIKVVPFTESMYEEVAKWYTSHGWEMAPVLEMLPDVGFVAVDEAGNKHAVGFLYSTNSNMYLLEWTATNPASGLKTRAKALKSIVKRVQQLTKLEKPLARVIQLTPNESIIRTYERLGFKKTEQGTMLLWS